MNRCTNLEWDTPCVDECVDVILNEDCKVLKLNILLLLERDLDVYMFLYMKYIPISFFHLQKYMVSNTVY